MAAGDSHDGLKTQEIAEVVREIRERVRSRYPAGGAGGVALPDLLPVLHARDAAQAKVASIGGVNPRPPGLLNAIVQAAKRIVARLLDWHVRDQVEFNRAMVSTIDAVLESLNENNRALIRLKGEIARLESGQEGLRDQVRRQSDEMRDIRAHWAEWRQEWERKHSVSEVQFLRSVADLEAGFHHRAAMMETSFRDLTRSQHSDFALALERTGNEIQKRLWAELERARQDYERLIHAELRLIRQRGSLAPPQPAPVAPQAQEPDIDWMWFAERFRGGADYVREKQRFYVPFFRGRSRVLDLGCGRGEFLELMKEAGVRAVGVDLSPECVALCRSKGLEAEQADLFSFLDGVAGLSLDGVFSAQVVEHLPPQRIPELIRLAASRLARGGLLVIETPNPGCLAALATTFFQDPGHSRPVPSSLLRFYLEESGFGGIEIRPLSPAVDSLPALASLPADFRDAFFGGLDYSILGRKL